MKSLFRILAVLMVSACVTFMGVSIAVNFGRAEPLAEMQTPEMTKYGFEQTGGASGTWTVTRRTGDKGNVGTFKTGYEALVKAHKDLADVLNQETKLFRDEHQKLKAADGQVAVFTASQGQDEAAMVARSGELQQLSVQYEAELLKKSEELQSMSVQSRAIRDETALRRTDVLRLRNELEEARTDAFRLTELRRTLTDELVRLQLDKRTLSERTSQIRSQLSP